MSQPYVTDHPSDFEPLVPAFEDAPPSKNSVGIVMAVLLLVAVLGGFYLFNRNAAEDVAPDQAVAAAADTAGAASVMSGEKAGQAVVVQK